MKRRKSLLIDIGLVIAGIWLFDKIFTKPKPAGISGLANALRKLTPIISPKGENYILKDFQQFHFSEHSQVIRMFEDARLSEHLKMPFFKTLKGTRITGELRRGQWRVLLYKQSDAEYLILSIFKKKTDETPPNEIAKAEHRLKEYLANDVPGLYYVS